LGKRQVGSLGKMKIKWNWGNNHFMHKKVFVVRRDGRKKVQCRQYESKNV